MTKLFEETETYYASREFKKDASIFAADLYLDAKFGREKFWAKQAKHLDWIKPWHTILEWTPPDAKWFVGGTLNACYNCVDRHITGETRNKAAIIWEGERGDTRTLTYWDLYREVSKFANVLKSRGIKKGDTVAIYMPMIPEAIISMLACCRIGAIHTVVFGGFSADALNDRVQDSGAKLVITADGGFRKGNLIRLKDHCSHPSIVVKHAGCDVEMVEGKDLWYHELMQNASSDCPVEEMDAEDRLFILYTSGTTGKPKGIVHTTGGYMVGANRTTAWVFDLKPSDIYWCTADVGWITGHTYVVYGPLSNGATQLIYEGSPDYPQKDRFWKLIEKYGVTILYTAPTAIRTFMKWGTEWPAGCNLSSLRLLGSVGEPINPEAWLWYYTHIGQKKCPIVDTWWQTETGSIMIAPLPAHTPLKPGSATFTLPGIEADIIDNVLAITSPWPSMLRGIHNDPERFYSTYWQKWDGKYYYTSDGAKRDADGYFWLMGRVDDVMNISGHRIGTMEVESALVDYPQIAEAAVIGVEHAIKGQGIWAFVLLKDGVQVTDDLEATVKQHVCAKIGAIARPERIIFTRDLPKTRSGKIMRRLLRDIAEGRVLGDLTTLADSSIIQELKSQYDD
ncbi:MAG: acetate--CoA ligase [Verrucomicrobia bacterium]|nr:acetate--CoA ligase [Verrucomicrobiota bacterium]MBS0637352.1 acetate--CoA ligase [Verrucomicrobiota bacterium]